MLERFLLGFEGTRLTENVRALLKQRLAGVALFRRNWESVEGLLAMTEEIRAAAPAPVLIGLDQEGGTPFSLPEPFTQWPAPAELGRLGDVPVIEDIAAAMGRELRAVGVNLNFAPMLDLHVHPQSPVTRGRSFGSDPQRVAEMGAAVVRGMAREGILSCAKHFPGHGDALADPHVDLPAYSGDLARLRGAELVPFAAAVRAGVPMVMTAHILLPRVDPQWPASLSSQLLCGTLRKEMKFDGVILADDIGMGAIRKKYGLGEAAIRAFAAGTDLVALCHNPAAIAPVLACVEDAATKGEFNAEDTRASLERIPRLRNACAPLEKDRPALGVIGCAEHRALAEELQRKIASAKG